MGTKDVYLKIETIPDYCPVDPDSHAAAPIKYRRDCMTWWPTQRPDDVLPRGASTRVPWARDSDDVPIHTKEQFLLEWRRLGFVVDTSGDRTRFEEVDRADARGRPPSQMPR